jgi:hypothetical protein
MSRSTRLALLAGVMLILAVSGTVLATRQPQVANAPSSLADEDEDAPPATGDLAHAADRLRASDIAVDEAVLEELATVYGVGGAVRILAWSADPEDDITVESIRALRDGDGSDGSGMGWGSIARELGIDPGIGSIMGNGGGSGNGLGRDSAPGQQDRDSGD